MQHYYQILQAWCASQPDTTVTTLDRISITYTCANNRIHFFSQYLSELATQ